MDIQTRIVNYWMQEAGRYSKGIQKELRSAKRDAWSELIREYATPGEGLTVLDIGTGPGYFAILLSALGHRVTAIDCTDNMLTEARSNVEKAGFIVNFQKMDCHDLAFEDGMFDLVVCRNLVWTLQDPQLAYRQWYRVLKTGGRLLVFDANWNLRLFDPELQRLYAEDRKRARELGIEDPHDQADIQESDDISRELFLSGRRRPQWDLAALQECGFRNLFSEFDISGRVWDECDRVLYRSTPMFLVGAEK